MATTAGTILKVFVASPGGVDHERDGVEEICVRVGSVIAARRNAAVTVQRWEQMVGGAGNPQAQINPNVDDCDVFVGIVHKRWGSDTGNGFDSGFSEEFSRALARWELTGEPRIALFFKRLDSDDVNDPGEQLKKVLTFRKSIGHTAFFKEYDSTDQLKLLVFQVLTEELMSFADDSPGEGGEAARPLDTDTQEMGQTPPSQEISEVLARFVAVMSDREVDGRLDIDRLELFGLAASYDEDPVPVHLANRIFARAGEVALSNIEVRALFRAYVSDLGRSNTASDRVIPFASMLGTLAELERLATEQAEQFLGSGEDRFAEGWLKLATSLGIRPRRLWPATPLAGVRRTEFHELWGAVANSTKMDLVIKYWLTVRRTNDVRLARSLRESSDTRLVALGSALVGLLGSRANADAVAEAAPGLLADETIRSLFANGNPFATLPDASLENLALRVHLPSEVRSGALDELIRRDKVDEKVLRLCLKSERTATILGDEWVESALSRLLDRAVSTDFIARLVDVASGSNAIPKRQARLALARLARHNDLVATATESLIEPDTHFSTEVAEMRLWQVAGTSEGLRTAEALADGTHEQANEYVSYLELIGSKPDVIAFVNRSFESMALRYLSQLPDARSRKQTVRRIRALAGGDGVFRYEAIRYLVDVFEDQDIDILIESIRYFNDATARRTIAAIVNRASIRRLGLLSASENEQVAVASLMELQRRDRPPSANKLTALLRSDRPTVRMAALAILTASLGTNELRTTLATYMAGRGTHYYNVVCELDRKISTAPLVHALL